MQVYILELAVEEAVLVDLVAHRLESHWIQANLTCLISAAKKAILHRVKRYPRHYFIFEASRPVRLTGVSWWKLNTLERVHFDGEERIAVL